MTGCARDVLDSVSEAGGDRKWRGSGLRHGVVLGREICS